LTRLFVSDNVQKRETKKENAVNHAEIARHIPTKFVGRSGERRLFKFSVVELIPNTILITTGDRNVHTRNETEYTPFRIPRGSVFVRNQRLLLFAFYTDIFSAIRSRMHIFKNAGGRRTDQKQGELPELRLSLSSLHLLIEMIVDYCALSKEELREAMSILDDLAAEMVGKVDDDKVMAGEVLDRVHKLEDSRGRKNPLITRDAIERAYAHIEKRIANIGWITRHIDSHLLALVEETDRCFEVFEKVRAFAELCLKSRLFNTGNTAGWSVFMEEKKKLEAELKSVHALPFRHAAAHALIDLQVAVVRLEPLRSTQTLLSKQALLKAARDAMERILISVRILDAMRKWERLHFRYKMEAASKKPHKRERVRAITSDMREFERDLGEIHDEHLSRPAVPEIRARIKLGLAAITKHDWKTAGDWFDQVSAAF